MTNQQSIWHELLALLQEKLSLLPDKPEETFETTLAAIWLKASGTPCSATTAQKTHCPSLTHSEESKLRQLIQQRISGVPLAHITGRQHFMGLDLIASNAALVPRKETELLAQAVLKLITNKMKQKQILHIDVCTGAGNIAIALAHNISQLRSYAADISYEAIQLTQKNIERFKLQNQIEALQGDLLKPFESDVYYNKVDLITCNPPYISSAKVSEMHLEIADHEPDIAFDGGPFGVSILRRLINEAPKFLVHGGWLCFEVGAGQGDQLVKQMMKNNNYSEINPIPDGHGNIRAILAQRQ